MHGCIIVKVLLWESTESGMDVSAQAIIRFSVLSLDPVVGLLPYRHVALCWRPLLSVDKYAMSIDVGLFP